MVRQVRRALLALYEDNKTIWVYLLLLVAGIAVALAIAAVVELSNTSNA